MDNPNFTDVIVLSPGEQVAYAQVDTGEQFVVTPIPNATQDGLNDVEVLTRVESLDDAWQWLRNHYGS